MGLKSFGHIKVKQKQKIKLQIFEVLNYYTDMFTKPVVFSQ